MPSSGLLTPRGSCKNQRFGGTDRLYHQGEVLVTTNVFPSLLILITLMMEVVRSSETSVLKRATRRNILECGFLHYNVHLIVYVELC
jgi:hypothetical protein